MRHTHFWGLTDNINYFGRSFFAFLTIHHPPVQYISIRPQRVLPVQTTGERFLHKAMMQAYGSAVPVQPK